MEQDVQWDNSLSAVEAILARGSENQAGESSQGQDASADAQQEQEQAQPPKEDAPAPVPYDRFKQSRQALQAAKAQNEKLEKELADLRARIEGSDSSKSAGKSDDEKDDSWLEAVFGGKGSKDQNQAIAAMSDPVLEAIKMEYAERQLDATLKAYPHVPQEVMLSSIAAGLDPETVAGAFEQLKALMGTQAPAPQGHPAPSKQAPPPRPTSGGQSVGAPAKPKKELPDNQYDRVEFVAKLLEGGF